MNTETESTITVIEVEGDELHLHYRGQHNVQPVHVTLDCDNGTLIAAASTIIGSGVPMHAWHGRWQRWTIPALTAEAANGLLEEILPLAERIVAGYSCEWDGSNHVGRYDDDAAEAIEAVQSLCDRDWDGQAIDACLSGCRPTFSVGECRRLCAVRRGASSPGGAGVTRASRARTQPPTRPAAGAVVAPRRPGRPKGLAGAGELAACGERGCL